MTTNNHNQGVIFDAVSARRIREVVKWVEWQSTFQTGRRSRRNTVAPDNSFWAKLTSSTLVSGIYQYAWTEQQRTSTDFQDLANGRTGTTTSKYSISSNNRGTQLANNTIVTIEQDYAPDGTPQYTFEFPGVVIGTTTADFTSGSTFTVGSLNITIPGGAYSMPYSTNVPSGTQIIYDPASLTLVGNPSVYVADWQYDTSAHVISVKYQVSFGTFAGTVSGWQSKETAVNCND